MRGGLSPSAVVAIVLCCLASQRADCASSYYTYNTAPAGTFCKWTGSPAVEWYTKDHGSPCDICFWSDCTKYKLKWYGPVCKRWDHGRRRRYRTRETRAVNNYECKSCGKGYYQNSRGSHGKGYMVVRSWTSCKSCPRGQYQNWSGRSSCKNCGVGKWSLEPTAKSASDCDNCEKGRFRRPAEVNAGEGCKDCPRGKYQQGTTFDSCSSCTGATFQDQDKQTSCKACLSVVENLFRECKCGAGKHGSLQKAMDGTCKQCEKGRFVGTSNLLTQCGKCPQGTYANQKGRTTCKDCPRGRMHFLEKRTSLNDCAFCPAKSFQAIAKGLCETCDSGMSSNAARTECEGCTKGERLVSVPASTTYHYGTANSNACSGTDVHTHTGYYGDGDAECETWAAGTSGVDFQYVGFWSNYPKGCFVHNGVQVYYNKHSEGGCGYWCQRRSTPVCRRQVAASQTCAPCQAGRWQDSEYHTEHTCKLCSAPNSFIPDPQVADRCLNCPPSTSLLTDANTCKCKAGSYGVGTSCTQCEAGRYHDQPNNAGECKACTGGQIADPATRAQCGCGAGQRRTYSSAAGGMTCEPCQAGRFLGTAFHRGACTACGAGKFSTAVGQTTDSTCTLCEAGKYHSASRGTCTPCPTGLAANGARTGCQCPAGTFTSQCNSKRAACNCETCTQANKYQPSPNLVFEYTGHGNQYTEVVPASVQDAIQQVIPVLSGDARQLAITNLLALASNQAHTCHADCADFKRVSDDGKRCECPAGKFRQFDTSISDAESCENCQGGHFRAVPSNLAQCEACPEGEYMPANGFWQDGGFTQCKDCTSGTFMPHRGAQLCEDKQLCAIGEGQLGELTNDPNDDGGTKKDRHCAGCELPELHATKVDDFGNGHSKTPRQTPAGSWSGAEDGNPCDENEICLAHEYEYKAPTTSSKRECRSHQDCADSQYQTSAPNEHDDRGCAALRQCNPGWFVKTAPQPSTGPPYLDNRYCEQCPPGQWSDTTNAATCTKCAAGKYHNGADPSSSEAASCTACSAAEGEYQDEEGRSECKTCDAGQYRDVAIASDKAVDKACPACPSGAYQQEAAKTGCTQCAPGKFQNMDVADFASNPAACHDCDATKGEYQPDPGETSCLLCSAGRFRDANFAADQQESTACPLCPDGSYQEHPGKTQCEQCLAGKYQDLLMDDHEELASSCRDCVRTSGEYQPLPGKTSCETCKAGTYRDQQIESTAAAGIACAACAAEQGQYQDDDAAVSCKVCQPGFARNVNVTSDRGVSEACAVCANGEYQQNEAKTTCTKCQAGTRQDTSLAQHKSDPAACVGCAPGQYQHIPGRTACVGCLPGTYQDTSMADHKSDPQSCKVCEVGQFQNSSAATECFACRTCAAGFELKDCSEDEQGSCSGCLPGRAKAGSIAWDDKCEACQPAEYQPAPEQAACLSCGAGKYRKSAVPATKPEDEACLQCSDGYYQDGSGEVDKCKACSAGTAQATTDPDYLQDPAACHACLPGLYQDAEGKTSCIACVHGQYQDVNMAQAASKAESCKACEAGQYQAEPAQTRCTYCTEGRFQDTDADDRLSNPARCVECVHGRFQGVKGGVGSSSKLHEACAQCPPGQYPNVVVHDPALVEYMHTGHFDKEYSVRVPDTDKRHAALIATAPDEGMLVPYGQSYAFCVAHNTQSHVCHERRWCEAAPAWKGRPAPAYLPHNNPRFPHHEDASFDDWCDDNCAKSNDRWTHASCPGPDGKPRDTSQCVCHEKRLPTVVDKSRVDQECNHATICSHVHCRVEHHTCDGHKLFKAFAAAHNVELAASRCDHAEGHTTLRVFHHGAETTCKDGHHCFQRGNQCLCEQRAASRPDADRCWIGTRGDQDTSLMACYRLCHQQNNQEACAFVTEEGFQDTAAPVLQTCGDNAASITLPLGSWRLCVARAMDVLDGDLTQAVAYTITKQGAGSSPTKYVCMGCTHGIAEANLRNLMKQDPAGAAGHYDITIRVCDDANNCAHSQQTLDVLYAKGL
eukprot:g1676.t1